MTPKIKGPIKIGHSFYPEVLPRNGKSDESNKKLVENWRTKYHLMVDEVFDRIMEERFGSDIQPSI